MAETTMGHHLGMKFEKIDAAAMVMSMPVFDGTRQPYGILHGGASVALAETIGSMASYLVVDPGKFYIVGLDINANHIRAKSDGTVYARATPLHLGRSTHVWDIKITDEAERLICISRLTVAVLSKADGQK